MWGKRKNSRCAASVIEELTDDNTVSLAGRVDLAPVPGVSRVDDGAVVAVGEIGEGYGEELAIGAIERCELRWNSGRAIGIVYLVLDLVETTVALELRGDDQ